MLDNIVRTSFVSSENHSYIIIHFDALLSYNEGDRIIINNKAYEVVDTSIPDDISDLDQIVFIRTYVVKELEN